MKAMIADDSLINVKVLKSFLEMQGVEVRYTTNDIESVTLCQEEKFDIIFLDYFMPTLNGCAAAAEIRKTINANSKIVIVTGDEEIARKRNLIGIDDYLLKPYDFEKICRLIEKPTQQTALR